jgi:hypothetical protein
MVSIISRWMAREVHVSTALKTAMNTGTTATTGNFTNNVQRQTLSSALPLALQAKHSTRAASDDLQLVTRLNVVKLRDPDILWSLSANRHGCTFDAPPAGPSISTNRIF